MIHNPGVNSYTYEFTHPEANKCGSGSAALVFLAQPVNLDHRHIMGRLPLQGFYMSRHVLSTAPPFNYSGEI
jgi:hypothetical protein